MDDHVYAKTSLPTISAITKRHGDNTGLPGPKRRCADQAASFVLGPFPNLQHIQDKLSSRAITTSIAAKDVLDIFRPATMNTAMQEQAENIYYNVRANSDMNTMPFMKTAANRSKNITPIKHSSRLYNNLGMSPNFNACNSSLCFAVVTRTNDHISKTCKGIGLVPLSSINFNVDYKNKECPFVQNQPNYSMIPVTVPVINSQGIFCGQRSRQFMIVTFAVDQGPYCVNLHEFDDGDYTSYPDDEDVMAKIEQRRRNINSDGDDDDDDNGDDMKHKKKRKSQKWVPKQPADRPFLNGFFPKNIDTPSIIVHGAITIISTSKYIQDRGDIKSFTPIAHAGSMTVRIPETAIDGYGPRQFVESIRMVMASIATSLANRVVALSNIVKESRAITKAAKHGVRVSDKDVNLLCNAPDPEFVNSVEIANYAMSNTVLGVHEGNITRATQCLIEAASILEIAALTDYVTNEDGKQDELFDTMSFNSNINAPLILDRIRGRVQPVHTSSNFMKSLPNSDENDDDNDDNDDDDDDDNNDNINDDINDADNNNIPSAQTRRKTREAARATNDQRLAKLYLQIFDKDHLNAFSNPCVISTQFSYPDHNIRFDYRPTFFFTGKFDLVPVISHIPIDDIICGVLLSSSLMHCIKTMGQHNRMLERAYNRRTREVSLAIYQALAPNQQEPTELTSMTPSPTSEHKQTIGNTRILPQPSPPPSECEQTIINTRNSPQPSTPLNNFEMDRAMRLVLDAYYDDGNNSDGIDQ